jgi:anhydro-N-acetylmuramic acid kinase
MNLFIGLMSGTSMDGIDAALVDVHTNQLIEGRTYPYSEGARSFLEKIVESNTIKAHELAQLNTVIGREFAFAVHHLLADTRYSSDEIIAIGSHGQTIAHDATAAIPYTIQLGCPHTIAELTGIKVIADFRTRDLVIGGQGAPFAPLYHQVLFGKAILPSAVVNVGGISNITYFSPAIRGYDIGPGNCLMDAWINKHLTMPYDKDGAWAAAGSVIPSLLESLLADPYFKLKAPKSLGKEYFSTDWLAKHLKAHDSAPDVQATLLAFTARTIADDIKSNLISTKNTTPAIVLCGGGAHNKMLCETLKKELPGLKINTSQALGINPDFIEAMMFAWLAEKALSQTPLDFKAITGAKKAAVYGAIYAKGI